MGQIDSIIPVMSTYHISILYDPPCLPDFGGRKDPTPHFPGVLQALGNRRDFASPCLVTVPLPGAYPPQLFLADPFFDTVSSLECLGPMDQFGSNVIARQQLMHRSGGTRASPRKVVAHKTVSASS
eukprot:763193-Hanusia_phi.AAC.3